MIVGTAGHIDHGKTTLVRALTGVDTDRLPEEKKRGITIELGYAFLDAGEARGADGGAAGGAAGGTASVSASVSAGVSAVSGEAGAAPPDRIGFIDVPGHERFVHTMLAGASGIDYALLLVAADDGVMPQTREHLAVLSLLGLQRGAVVLTKADRVDAVRLKEVRAQTRELLAHSTLAEAPLLEVSALHNQGIAELKSLLQHAARHTPAHRCRQSAFRLAIDRAFTLAGVGTVVTGTVHAGEVQVGDELALVPGTGTGTGTGSLPLLRVRSLHAQNQPVQRAHAGQRCAVALVGIAKDDIARGQWLVAPAVALATSRLDVQLTLWPGEPKALRTGTPVHVHVGATDVLATVAVLKAQGNESLAPGDTAFAQLVLRSPIAAWHGDRVVLRDASASRTLAGGSVLDPQAPVRYRRTPQRLAELQAQLQPTATERLAALVASATHGIDLQRWAKAEGLPAGTTPPLPPGTLRHTDAHTDQALGAAQVQSLRAAVLTALQHFHATHPDELGPDAARLRRLTAPRLPEPLWRALLAAMQAQALVTLRAAFVHLPEHGIKLSAADERIAQKAAPLLAQAAFEGAWARDLARDTKESEALMRTSLARLAQRGELHQVVKDLFYPPATMAKLAALAREVAAREEGTITAAHFRDATGLGRKRAIQLLEYFDRVGLLRRVGDLHRLRSDTALFTPP